MSENLRFKSREDFDAFMRGSHIRVHGEPRSVVPVTIGKKEAKRAARSKIEAQMSHLIKLANLPPPIEHPTQYKPFPNRKFSLDFAWPQYKIGLEVDGGAHAVRARFTASFERGALLLLDGWKMLHVGENEVMGGIAVEWLRQLLEQAQNGQ